MKISHKSVKLIVYLVFATESLLFNIVLGKFVQQFVPHSSVFEKLIFGVASLLFMSAVITSIGGLALFADDRFKSKPFVPWLIASLIVAPIVTCIACVAFVLCVCIGGLALTGLVGAAVAMDAATKIRALVNPSSSPEFAMEGKLVR